MLWNNVTLEGLSTSIKHTELTCALAYDEMIIMWWNDEILEGLHKSIKDKNCQVHWHMIKWTFT